MPVTAADDGLMIYLVDGTTRCVQMYNANIPQWEDMYCMPLPAPTGIIYYQDFETVPNTPELTYVAGAGSVSTGSAVDPNSPMFSEGTQGYEMTNFGQAEIFNSAGGGAYPTGWTDTNNVTPEPIDKGTYYLVDAGVLSDEIVTAVYDLSTYTSATFTLDVASYGGGGHNEAKIEISDDGGATYTQLETSVTTTGTTYIAGGSFLVANLTNQVQIKISNNGASGRGIRLRNIILEATGGGTRDIDFMLVDTSAYTTNTFSFDLASFGSATNGADQADYIEVFTSTDGATYTSQIKVTGAVAGNTKWNFSGSATASTTYGTPITIVPVDPSPAASPLSIPNSYSKVVLSGLPSVPTLYIRIKFRNDHVDESWCIDNVILNLN